MYGDWGRERAAEGGVTRISGAVVVSAVVVVVEGEGEGEEGEGEEEAS